MTLPATATTDMNYLKIIFYGVTCLITAVSVSMCRSARHDADTLRGDLSRANAEANDVRAALAAAQAENAALRDLTRRANEATLRAVNVAEEALGKHEERQQSIETASPDWLMCELPDSVRDAFAGYTASEDNSAAVSTSETLHETTGLRDKD